MRASYQSRERPASKSSIVANHVVSTKRGGFLIKNGKKPNELIFYGPVQNYGDPFAFRNLIGCVERSRPFYSRQQIQQRDTANSQTKKMSHMKSKISKILGMEVPTAMLRHNTKRRKH